MEWVPTSLPLHDRGRNFTLRPSLETAPLFLGSPGRVPLFNGLKSTERSDISSPPAGQSLLQSFFFFLAALSWLKQFKQPKVAGIFKCLCFLFDTHTTVLRTPHELLYLHIQYLWKERRKFSRILSNYRLSPLLSGLDALINIHRFLIAMSATFTCIVLYIQTCMYVCTVHR